MLRGRLSSPQLVVIVILVVSLSLILQQRFLSGSQDAGRSVDFLSADLDRINRKINMLLEMGEEGKDNLGPRYNRTHLIKRYCEQEKFRKTIRAESYSDPKAVWNLWEPLTACTAMDRVGSTGDGGKWACDVGRFQGKDCVVYSFGVKDDISFETFFHKQGCETHSFDPTPGVAEKMTPKLKPGMTYHKIALGPVANYPSNPSYQLNLLDTPVEVQNLQQIAASLGHKHVDILKIDIEGSEWDAIPYFLEQPDFSSFKVNQILVELHWTLNQGPAPFEKTTRFFETMERHGYFPFQKEANLYWAPFGMEYSFIYRGPVDCSSSGSVIPTGRVIPKYVPEKYDQNPLGNIITPMKDALLLDIGANVGIFVDKWLNIEQNRVYMFEPSPKNVETLKKKYPKANARIFPLAVSDKKGELTLYDSENCPANPSLVPQEFWKTNCKFTEFTVKVDTVDNLVDGVVTLMKIDTQGNEVRVLNGAKKMMTSNPPKYIHSEFWPNGLINAGVKPEELLELIFSYNYYCYNYPDEHFNSQEITLIRDAKDFTRSIMSMKSSLIPEGHGPWGAVWCVHDSVLKVK